MLVILSHLGKGRVDRTVGQGGGGILERRYMYHINGGRIWLLAELPTYLLHLFCLQHKSDEMKYTKNTNNIKINTRQDNTTHSIWPHLHLPSSLICFVRLSLSRRPDDWTAVVQSVA